MRKTGIYQLINKINNKSYVGSTIDSSERYWSHISKLSRQVHDNKSLQEDFNKYGRDCFELIMLEECLECELLEREQYWSDKISNKYNIRVNVKSNIGLPHSDKVKSILSEKRKGAKNPFYGKTHTAETNAVRSQMRGSKHKKSKLVINTLTGIFYDCAREAGEAHGIKNSTIISMLNGNNKNKTNLRYA